MKRNLHSVFILFVVLCSFAISSFGQNFHVSPNGKDDNSGSLKYPLASFAAARIKVNEYKKRQSLKPGTITVWIHGGTFDLDSSFELSKMDAGTKRNPIVWRAMPGEEVHITGGRSFSGKLFQKKISKEFSDRLPLEARAHVMSVDLKKQGINNFGENKQYGHALPVIPAPLELFFNNEPMPIARYPNKGYLKVGKVVDAGSVPRIGDKSRRGARFHYEDQRISKWAGKKDIWLQGTFNYGFADDCIEIASIDSADKLISLKSPHLYGVASGRDFQQYVALNIPEELDSPGEWYLDREEGILYLWPPSDYATAEFSVSILQQPVIALKNTSYCTIKGLFVESGRGMGIYLENTDHCAIRDCVVRNMGTSGIFMGQGATAFSDSLSIDDYDGWPVSGNIGSLQNHLYRYTAWDRKAGHDNLITGCEVYNTGSGGIYLSGGTKFDLKKGNNIVDNCKIHDYNRRNKFTWAGINVDGCGNTIVHCEIYGSDWQGIYVHGNDHLFEYNEIHHVTLNSDDTSPWYIGRDPSDRGNIVRYNYFHHCGNANRMNMGIYCDDSSTGVTVFGNVFYKMNTTHGVLFSNSGWHLLMRNNIVVEPMAATAEISAHYYTWAAGQAVSMFGEKGLLRRRLTGNVHFDKPPYSIRYPELLSYLDTIVAGKEWKGMRSYGNELSGNVIIGGPADPVSLKGGKYATIAAFNNYVSNEDPGFVDMKGGDFTLKQSSIVFKRIKGFQPVPFGKMGLRKPR